ncbi:MAG: redoxin domain-containing protein [Bacteroidota bacterium]|nr:redoxin domain-containing protein [Bacteroidota bacterium]
MSLNVGDKAPDFTLTSFTPSTDTVDYTLSLFKDKKNVMLIFFPQAFTGTCTDEMCTISKGFNEFSEGDTEVLGISVDGTFVQKAFAKDNKIKIPLLSDFNKETINKYGIVHENFAHGMKNVAKRSVFLIGKDGLIKYMEITENPGVQVNFDKIKEAIKNL